MEYDTKLDNATYDAIKAFQINAASSSTSDVTNSKIRDIEAAANSFFTSLETSFNRTGYNRETLKDYVPALVFTLYDGFYIYSSFENTIDEEIADRIPADSTYQPNETVDGLRPYVYYSCRYIKGTMDVTITYSLDNYITVQGYDKSGNPIHDAGYVLNNVTYNDATKEATYRGVTIQPESMLSEFLGQNEYPYIKINGIKYYYIDDGTGNTGWYYILNGDLTKAGTEFNDHTPGTNDMAYRYYKEAADFWNRLNSYGILELKSSDAVDKNGQPLNSVQDEDGNIIYDFIGGNHKIFEVSSGKGIEEPDSNFNDHRLAVIRYVIEQNLSVALANYNNGVYNFRMPKLSEEDWTRILNNISLISFMQGLGIEGKVYNGYSVINNNANEEVVTENSIYIVDSSNTYHRITSTDINTSGSLIGIFNNDFERKTINPDDEFERLAIDASRNIGDLVYYYPRRQLGCYSCYVTQRNNASSTNIYQYLSSNDTLALIYYTALGRERYSMYKSQIDRDAILTEIIAGNLPSS